MRLIRTVLIGFAGLIVLVLAVGFLLPRHVTVEREIVIDAPPEVVFAKVNSLQAFSEWSPWGDIDPQMVVAYSGPDSGVGNVMEWTSDHANVGNGRQEIVDMVENESVRTALDFEGMPPSEAWWRLVPEADGTRVIWGLEADMGAGPVGRWFGLMLDGWVGADYARGLERLRMTVEG